MLNSSAYLSGEDHKGDISEVPSVIQEVVSINYCQNCVRVIMDAPSSEMTRDFSRVRCGCPNPENLKANLYWHNVPTINGYELPQDRCAACQLGKRPQQGYHELDLCEKELGFPVKHDQGQAT
jgi:hypothetical protein